MDSRPPKPPEDPLKIDPSWLSWHLGEAGLLGELRVQDVAATSLGEAVGFLSRMARLVPRYSGDSKTAPSSLVIKLETNDPKLRGVADRLHAFRREIGFYRHMALDAPTRLAKVYASGDAEGVAWLLFEDLAQLAPGDQVRGLSNRQVEMALRHIAAVHAASWQDPRLEHYEWLPAHDFFFQDDFEKTWPAFRENYALRMGREGMALLERVLERQDLLEAKIAERPTTLVHGDLRADNLLLGEEGSDEEVLILDWQTATRSLAAIDVAQLVGGSEPPPERAGHTHGLFRAWHDTLRSHGVDTYSAEEGLMDLRLSVLSCMRIPLLAFKSLGGPDFEEARPAQLADALALRHISAALELDAGTVLP